MPTPGPLARPPARTRALAWLVTGPVGHAIAGALDWIALGLHYARARLAGREPWEW